MTENFATSLEVREDATGPAGLIAGPYRLDATSALLGRETLTSIQRRDFWRAVTKTLPIISAHGLGWEFDVGDCDSLELVLDAMADPGRSTDSAGVRTWRFGRPESIRRFDFIIDPVEAGHFELLRAGCQSAQIIMERGRLASCVTRWGGQELSTTDTSTDSTPLQNQTFAAAPTCTIEIEDFTGPVFSGALLLQRDIEPAGYDETGVASGFKGQSVVDILGRLACRASTADFADMMAGDVLERSVVITMTAGTRRRVLTMPACRLEVGERQLIGQGTYEHLIEFAVIRTTDQDCLSVTSEEI